MEKEKIKADEFGEWTCICGNVASENGFFRCDEQGNYVEPTEKEWTTNLYKCDRCNRLIDQDTLEVRS